MPRFGSNVRKMALTAIQYVESSGCRISWKVNTIRRTVIAHILGWQSAEVFYQDREVYEKTYMIPRPNIPIKASLLDRGIFSFHTKGIGIITIIRSVNRFRKATSRIPSFWFPQTPPEMVLSHWKAKGRQMARHWIMLPRPSIITITTTVSASSRNLFSAKMALYISRIEILVAVFAIAQSTSAAGRS